MKYLKRHTNKFMKLCDAPLAQSAKTRQAVLNQCPNDLFVNTCRLNISAKKSSKYDSEDV